jgi:choline dehydrogenase-like flavoprotein
MRIKHLIILILVIIILWIIIETILTGLSHNFDLPKEADVVIIGGGVAACVVAKRLHDRYPKKSIVILERGRDYRNDRNVYRSEAALSIAYSEPYSEVLIPEDAGVICSVAKMSGGGSSHNFGLVVKASKAFYETQWLHQLNILSEEFADIHQEIDKLMDITPLPVKIDIISRILPSVGRVLEKGVQEIKQGIDVIQNIGPLRANNNISVWIHDALIKTKQGLMLVDDYNSGIGACVCDTPQLFVDKVLGMRASVNRAYLPSTRSKKLNLIELADVSHIERKTVILKDGRTILARQKIIMAAGAIRTPSILLRSGFVNPDIGQNLTEHYGCTMVLAVRYNDNSSNGDFSSGPLAFVSNSVSQIDRNWQIVTSGSTLTNFTFLESQGIDVNSYKAKGYNFITFLGWNVTPKARGTITLSSDPQQDINIDMGLFSSTDDNNSIVALLQYFGQIYNKMKETGTKHDARDLIALFPSETVFANNDYTELLNNAKTGVSLTDHYCSTCRYEDVINSDFSLKENENIHVVDASTFPSISDGNTEYPTLLISEIASRRIFK